VILNWNGEEHLPECLASIEAARFPSTEVLVVDNASTDSSRDIAKQFSGVRLIINERNVGYAAGNNVGFRQSQGTYVATLNNDTIVDPQWLPNAVAALESCPRAGIAACRQMRYDSPTKIDSLFLYPQRDLSIGQMGHKEIYDERRYGFGAGAVFGAAGASAVYRKSMLEDIGLFDERFSSYNEESDLCMRALLAGWICLYEPSAVIYHKGSASFSSMKTRMLHLGERNRMWFLYKYFPMRIVAGHLHHLLLREALAFAVLAFKKRSPGTYLSARLDALRGIGAFGRERVYNVQSFSRYASYFSRLIANRILTVDSIHSP
jgi:GT2 family glycosyltransferase